MSTIMDITLYWFPESYYSQKVLLTLYEQNVPFKEKIVKMQHREHFQSWFERLNPKRQVPVLKNGNDVIAESDTIIDYLCSKLDTEANLLVPDSATGVGEEIAEFRWFLQQVPVSRLTYGLLINPRLHVKRVRFPALMTRALSRKNVERNADVTIDWLRRKQRAEPVRSAELEADIAEVQQKTSFVYDEARVSDLLDDLEHTFDKIQQQLQKAKAGTSNGDFWLFGTQFTAADISAAIFMYRVYKLGIDERYFSESKRPLVHDYYGRIKLRPTFQKMVAKQDAAMKQVVKAEVGSFAVKAVKVGVAVGVTALILLGGREYFKARRVLTRV